MRMRMYKNYNLNVRTNASGTTLLLGGADSARLELPQQRAQVVNNMPISTFEN